MSHTISIPDELYHAIEEYAARRGETAEAAVLAWAEQLARFTASAPSMPESGPENGLEVPSRVDNPRFDPWAGFRGVAEAKSADSVDRHDSYLAEDAFATHEPER